MPTPNDYLKLAEESLEQAKTLAGEGTLGDKQFLESMSQGDRLMDHPDCMTDAGTCGHCMTQWCYAEAARKLLAQSESDQTIDKWSELSHQMWKESKYYKLYQDEVAAGRDPHKAFEQRGWEL